MLAMPSRLPRTHQTIAVPVVAAGLVRDGSAFRLPVMADALPKTVRHLVNVQVVAVSDAGASISFAPVTLRVAGSGRTPVTVLGRFGAYSRALWPDGTGQGSAAGHLIVGDACTATTLQTTEDSTRIGELHVANNAAVTGSYAYSGHADSAFSVGLSNDGSSWLTSGQVSITNTGLGGTVSSTGSYRQYIDADYHYSELKWQGTGCATYYTQQPTSWAGDVFAGPNSPPSNPWGSCSADPNGETVVSAGNSLTVDNQSAATYSAAADPFGDYTFSDTTGYSPQVQMSWTNNSSTATYLCGTTSPLGGAIYNDNS
jgi:hypothetical protein